MQSKVKVTPYEVGLADIKVRDLVKIAGLKSIHIVVSCDGTSVEVLSLANKAGDFPLDRELKRFRTNDLVHYNGDIIISQRV